MASSEVFSDRYELLRHIARGGMAQVYLAQDLLLDRPVAIKVLFPELSSDPSFVERFRREAQAAANLSHANIVSIYDWGQGEHTYFIVMEYIDGQTLSALIRQVPLPAARAASIGADMAGALDFAHRRGVIHRDVKPGNVLIDRTGQVKVADFGIARAVSHASEGLTQTGAVMGTATYFSPEQAQGLPVDARSDVYSLGVVLYEMVTGKPPFLGDSPVAIAYKHVREFPSLPSSLNPSVPADFEAVVMAAMAKDPESRYQSAGELREDLLRFQQGQPVLAPHPVTGGTTRAVAGPPAYPGYDPYDTSNTQRQTRAYDETEAIYQGNYEAAGPARRPRSRAGWWAGLFILLLAVLGALVFFIGRNANWWGTPSDIRVPVLKGDPVAQAEQMLHSQGFLNVQVKDAASLLVPDGQVIGTSPGSGASVPPSRSIILEVSSGAPFSTVPSLAKQSCGNADTALKSRGFVYKNLPQNSAKVASGLVLATNPPAGTKVRQQTQVEVICSAGQATTTVPNLQGFNPAQAGAKLAAAHLKAGNLVTVASATVKAGLVAYSSPSAGNPEPWGAVVTLYVSGGQQTTTVPPDLVGETEQQAQKELTAVDLYSAVDFQPVTNAAENGDVISTNPAPGALVREGTAVTLNVGEYTGPTTTTPPPTTSPRVRATTTTAPAATTTSTVPAATTTVPAATTTVAVNPTTSAPAATTTLAAAVTTTTAPAASTTSTVPAATTTAAATRSTSTTGRL